MKLDTARDRDKAGATRATVQENQYRPQREEASLMAITLIQIGLLVLVAVSVFKSELVIGAVLLGIALIGIIGRIWAGATAKRLYVSVRADKIRMFPGDKTKLTYRVKNEKLLPVLWVDVFQPLDNPVCMEPVDEDGTSCLREMTRDEREMYKAEAGTKIFCQRCSMIGGYKTVGFDTSWQAKRRGLYRLNNTRIYTGDGFGTTNYRLSLASNSQTQFAIYPRIVPVSTEPFQLNMWEGESGSKGTVEDLSLIKSTRPYESTDSLKKINWRLVARGQGLAVNQYEVIRPKAIHFIFDGESFNGLIPKTDALEETLSILASLLLRLTDNEMECGFSFPETRRLPGENIFAEEGSVGKILYRMAEYQLKLPVKVRNQETGMEEEVLGPPVFLEEEILEKGHQIGKYYFVTFNERTAAASTLLKKLEKRPLKVLTYGQLSMLKKGGCSHGKAINL